MGKMIALHPTGPKELLMKPSLFVSPLLAPTSDVASEIGVNEAKIALQNQGHFLEKFLNPAQMIHLQYRSEVSSPFDAKNLSDNRAKSIDPILEKCV